MCFNFTLFQFKQKRKNIPNTTWVITTFFKELYYAICKKCTFYYFHIADAISQCVNRLSFCHTVLLFVDPLSLSDVRFHGWCLNGYILDSSTIDPCWRPFPRQSRSKNRLKMSILITFSKILYHYKKMENSIRFFGIWEIKDENDGRRVKK